MDIVNVILLGLGKSSSRKLYGIDWYTKYLRVRFHTVLLGLT